MEVLQVASELEPMLELYRERKPKRVLEIGCWDGGTLREWLTQVTPDIVVAVDLEHRNQDAYTDWTHKDTNLVLATGQSQDEPQIQVMRDNGPYDWVFIDGDHGDWGVMTDVANTRPLIRAGGLMLLHDIQAGSDYAAGDYPPRKVLQRFSEDHETWEYVEEGQMPWAHGIGVIQL